MLEYLLERGVLLGPLNSGVINNVAISRFGVIPKKNQPGKWRLIVSSCVKECQ